MKIVIGTDQFGEDYADQLGARFPRGLICHGPD